MCVVVYPQDGTSALVHFAGKPVVASRDVSFFLRLENKEKLLSGFCQCKELYTLVVCSPSTCHIARYSVHWWTSFLHFELYIVILKFECANDKL